MKYVDNKNARIIDLGCGNGAFISQLKKNGFKNVEGVDFKKNSDVLIDDTILINELDISYSQLPFKDNSIDVVTAWEIIEHLENPFFAFREIFRILKPNGFFMFSVPNIFHWSNKIYFPIYGNIVRYTKVNDHRTLFTRDLFKKALLDKFSLEKILYRVPVWWPQKARGFPWGRINIFCKKYIDKRLPETEWFSHFTVYVLKK